MLDKYKLARRQANLNGALQMVEKSERLLEEL